MKAEWLNLSPWLCRIGSRRSLAAVSAILVLAVTARAERVVLRNGNQITGSIVSETEDRITLRTSSGLVSFRRTAIAAIHRQTEADNRVSLVQEAVTRGDLPKALQAAQPPLSPELRSRIDSALLAGGDQILSSGRPSRTDAARFRAYVESRETSPPAPLQLLLARYLSAAGDNSAAVAQLRSMDRGFLSRDPIARPIAADLLSSEVAAALEQDEPERGLDCVELFAAVAPERLTSSTAILLRLREAQRLADRGAFLPAAEEIGVFVLPHAPETAMDEITRLLSRAEQQTTVTAVVDLYEAVHRHFSRAGFAAELLPVYERHVDALLRLGRIREARIVAGRVSRLDADAGAPVEHRVEFAARQAEISSDDPVANYRLAVWAREVGLFNEARNLLRLIQLQPELRENASLQLELLETEVQRRDFEKACRLLEEKDYGAARVSFEAFRAAYPQSEFATRAGELAELARYHIWSAAKRRPEEGEVLRQNAERLLLQGRYKESLELVNRIEVDFQGTDAAAQADKLRKMIRVRSAAQGAQGTARSTRSEMRRMAEIRAMALDLARRTEGPARPKLDGSMPPDPAP